MKRLAVFGTLMWVLVLVLIPGLIRAQNTQNFNIESFDADYYLTRNDAKTSQYRVVEKIVALFPDYDQNHGILRAIPKTYQDNTLSLNIESVKNETGQNYNYSTYDENDNKVLKIGDADRYVHGLTTYIITYDMRNVITYFNDHDELYWDVNGNSWLQNFNSVTARLHIPKELTEGLSDRPPICYAGGFGEKGSDCTLTTTEDTDGNIVTTQALNLGPGETLTFVAGFKKGTFVQGPEVARAKLRQQLIIIGLIACVVIPPLLALIIMRSRWKKFGKDEAGRGVIIPEYQRPKGLSVLGGEMILKEKLSNGSISALIIDLAVRRYFTIYQDGKKYEIELAKDPSDLPADEKKVVDAIFSDETIGNRVTLDSLKNKLYSTVTQLNKQVGDEMSEKQFFRQPPQKARQMYLGWGVFFLILGFVLLFTAVGTALGIGLLLSGGIVMLASLTMPARTEAGVAVRDHMLGLKDYMKLAEADRIKFLQSPAGVERVAATGNPESPAEKIKLFEKLLPFAMLFGIEKQWGKQFEDLYKQPPEWFQGNWSTFRTAYLISSIGNVSAATATAFTAPSSSGSSGFGGGGFSGGGGGGGGGGGW